MGKKHRSLPPGMTYAEVLAQNRLRAQMIREAAAWQTGKPPEPGLYWVKADVEGQNIPQEARWADGVWSYPFTGHAMDFPVTGWWPLPEG